MGTAIPKEQLSTFVEAYKSKLATAELEHYEKPDTFQVELVHYSYDISNDKDMENYRHLVNHLRGEAGFKLFDSITSQRYGERQAYIKELKAIRVHTLSTRYLFGNQFNSEEGHRLFIWRESISPNKNIKEGYYMTGSEESVKHIKNIGNHYIISTWTNKAYHILEAEEKFTEVEKGHLRTITM